MALLLVLAGSLALGVGNAATSTDAIPVAESMIGAFSKAANSCSALTPPRLAGQVMAATRFVPTAEGGISGLSAADWKKWKPSSDASPSDPSASVLALAHMTCDLVGQVRVAGILGDPWQLALAASQSSIKAMKAVAGVPSAVAAFVDRVDAYADWYALQPGLAPSAATPMTPPPSAIPAPTQSPASLGTSPTPVTTPTQPAPPAVTTPATTTPPAPPTPAVSLNYTSFVGSSGLLLNGSASVAGGKLNLAANWNQAGSAWSTAAIDPTASFTTSFAALITKPTDGVAFVIQTQAPTALGAPGGGLGYGLRPGDAGARINPSLDIELDAWDNSPDGFDPPGHQHIAVMTNGDVTNHLIWRDPGFGLYGTGPVYVWLTYDARAHVLTLYASNAPIRPGTPLFSFPFNLETVVGTGRAYVGFTGGTGYTTVTDAQESILSWSFTSG